MNEIVYEKTEDHGYRDRMLLCLKSEYLLSVSVRNLNQKSEYCYETKDRRPLSAVFENTLMKGADTAALFCAMRSVMEKTGEHLLKPDGLVLFPDRIMLNNTDHTPAFIYCPSADPSFKEGCIRLGEFLINKVDTGDEKAVKLCYAFYETANSPAPDIPGFLKKNLRPDAAPKETAGSQNKKNLPLKADTDRPQAGQKDLPSDADEEQKQYYYTAPEYEDEEDDPLLNIPEKGLLKLLIICSALIVIAGGAYTYIFLNPGLLKAVGISQQDYILAGALLTSIMAMIIITLLQVYVHKRQKNENTVISEKS